MSDPLQNYLFTEVPKRPILIKGLEKATGDPNNSDLIEVNKAPIGTFYMQDDAGNKLWQKKGSTATDWQEIAGATGGTANPEDLEQLKQQQIIIPRSVSFDNVNTKTISIDGTTQSIVSGSVDVISQNTGQVIIRNNNQVTATITETGDITFNILPYEPVQIIYGIRVRLDSLPEDFLIKHFYTSLDEKNIKTMINNVTTLQSSLIMEQIKPTGLFTKNTASGPTITFSYPQSEELDHFVLERYNEDTKTWEPYDGANGIIYP